MDTSFPRTEPLGLAGFEVSATDPSGATATGKAYAPSSVWRGRVEQRGDDLVRIVADR